MTYNVGLTMISHNSKTGPIPVSATESSTCNPDCAEKETCYGKFGYISIHWKKIDEGERGMDWDEFCHKIKRLPHAQLWRHNQAGDLPGNGKKLDTKALTKLVKANKGKRGFTFTHYPPTMRNLNLIEQANADGFTVNISCDDLHQADVLSKKTTAPLVVVLPSTTTEKVLYLDSRKKVVVCPATYREDMNCQRCAICHNCSPDRAVIGFPAHGSRKFTIDRRLAA